jgi:hypothetical protein
VVAVGVPRHCWGGVVKVMLAGLQWWAAGPAVAGAGRKSGHSSGGLAVVLPGWRWRNARTSALLGRGIGGGRAAVLVGRRRGVSCGEG